MAQIAGRAGRHQNDGSFGTLGLGGEEGASFSDEEIDAIEEHRFRPLDSLYWRNADLDFTDVRTLIASLETKSDDPVLRSAPEAIDLAVLKLNAEDPAIAAKRGVAGAAAMGGVRPARFPQGRADAPRAHGPAPVQLHRRRRARPARMVRRRGRPARQYERRH